MNGRNHKIGKTAEISLEKKEMPIKGNKSYTAELARIIGYLPGPEFSVKK